MMEQEIINKLPPCPDSSNCVNSVFDRDEKHYLAPINISEDPALYWATLIKKLEEDKFVEIIKTEENFIRSTFRIPVFGFIDDVLFYYDQKNKLIHFRSSSRVGYYDFGVNKNRMKKIRKQLHKQVLER